jgi:hypothetical protein
MDESIPPVRAEGVINKRFVSVLMKSGARDHHFKILLDEICVMHQIPRRSGPVRKKEQKWE